MPMNTKDQKWNLVLIAFSLSLSNASASDTRRRIIFTENKGQVSDQHYQPRPDVHYYGEQGAMDFHITDRGISYQLSRVNSWKADVRSDGRGMEERVDSVPAQIQIRRIDITWPGADPNAVWLANDMQKGHLNFYLQVCPDGVTDVHSYGELLRKNIYPGIDLRYYSADGELKYDYLVAAHADIGAIKLDVAGAQLELTADGGVRMKTPLGDVMEEAPVVFQDGKPLVARWILTANRLSFAIDGYDRSKPLIIDPAIRLGGTYYGGNFSDEVMAIEPLTGNDLMIAGETASVSNIATTGTFDVSWNGNFDSFVARMTGHTDRVWGTYFGGSGLDEVNEMHLRPNDRIAVTGRTSSMSGIASTAAYQGTFGGGTFDAYIVWFNNGNGQRTYGTYFGGTGNDSGNGIVSDANGVEYCVGLTTSTSAIATPGSFLPTGTGNDGFLLKMDASGGLVWSTYLPGSGRGVALSSTGSVSVGGYTALTSGVSTLGAHQIDLAGGTDGYLLQFTPNGQRIWGTYYGGEDDDFIFDLKVDPTGNVIAVGSTRSADSIATFGAPLYTYGDGTENGMIIKFNGQGERIWGRYFSGQYGVTTIYTCAVDGAGSVYVGGVTSCHLDPAGLDPYLSIITTDAIQGLNPGQGIRSGFFARLDPNGERMWGSYYGGFLEDAVWDVAVTPQGRIFIAGYGQQSQFSGLDDYLLTPGAWDVTAPLDDASEGFYAIICTTLELFVTTTGPTCFGDADGTASVVATGGGALTSYSWNPAPGGGSGTQVTGLVGGVTYQVTGNSILGACAGSTTVSFTMPNPILNATIPMTGMADCNGTASGSLELNVTGGTPPYSFFWNNNSTVEDPTGLIAGPYQVEVTDANGCTDITSSSVEEPAPIVITANITDAISGADGAVDISISGGTPGYTYAWAHGDLTEDLEGVVAGTYELLVTDQNGCQDSITVEVQALTNGLEQNAFVDWNVIVDQGLNTLQVTHPASARTIELLDARGRSVASQRTSSALTTMDLHQLAPGLYTVRLTTSNEQGAKRFVLAR